MTTTVALRTKRVHASRVDAPHRPQPGHIASTEKPATTWSIVQAAVDAKYIPDSAPARDMFLKKVNANQVGALNEIVEHRRIQAATYPVVPPGHEVTARPVTASPTDAGLYPSSWALPASQAAGQSGNRPRATAASKTGLRVTPRGDDRRYVVTAATPQTVHAAGETRAYLEAQARVAAANQAQAQRRLHTHTDPHNLIAAASAPARAQQAAAQAELDRRAAARTRRYGR